MPGPATVEALKGLPCHKVINVNGGDATEMTLSEGIKLPSPSQCCSLSANHNRCFVIRQLHIYELLLWLAADHKTSISQQFSLWSVDTAGHNWYCRLYQCRLWQLRNNDSTVEQREGHCRGGGWIIKTYNCCFWQRLSNNGYMIYPILALPEQLLCDKW